MFNSKISGKKKLALDGQILTELKTYSYEFSYSFKIDKHYFNIDQISADKFELRIDNRSFTAVQTEEKFKPKEEIKISKNQKSPIKQPINHLKNNNNLRNSNIQFFNENDFDFDDSNTNTKIKSNLFPDKHSGLNHQKSNFIISENIINDKNTKKPQNKEASIQNNNVGLLIDFGESSKIENKSKYNEKAVFSQLSFDNNMSKQENNDIYNHNNQIFDNINLDFASDGDEEKSQNVKNLQGIPINKYNNSTSNNDLGLNNINFDNYYGNSNQQEINNQNMGLYQNYDNMIINNKNLNMNLSTTDKISSSPQINIINNIDLNTSDNQRNNNLPQNNEFKERILGKGLINLDNLLDDNVLSQKRSNLNQINYNFDLSGPKLEINPNTLDKNPSTNMQYLYQNNINPGYGMALPQQPMMNQQMNDMCMFNNNPQMNMNIGYPQTGPYNYFQNNLPQNMGFNVQNSSDNYSQNFPQQNKAVNPAGNVLDFF